jgi:hypothetical protein
VVSPELIAEYHEAIEVLRREYPKHSCTEWAAALSEAATLVFPVERAGGATPDPGDEMVLECALAAEANLMVTGDKKHGLNGILHSWLFLADQAVSPLDSGFQATSMIRQSNISFGFAIHLYILTINRLRYSGDAWLVGCPGGM